MSSIIFNQVNERCPRCSDGFIEEMPARPEPLLEATGFFRQRLSSDELSDDNSDDIGDSEPNPIAQVLTFFQQPLNYNTMPNIAATINNNNNPSSSSTTPSTTNTTNTTTTTSADTRPSTDSDATSSTTNTSQSMPNQARLITRTPASSTAGGTPAQIPVFLDPTQNQTIADVLNDFITGVSFGTRFPQASSADLGGSQPAPNASRGLINIDFPLPFFLHSNPGDYAWGTTGFDAVITQLLNSLDGSNSGPPPMSKEQIKDLNTVEICDEQVKNKNIQCTICMEDFQVGDEAKQLPCEHIYHEGCILPWLELHASCPICRKTFVSSNNATTSGSGNSDATTDNRQNEMASDNQSATNQNIASRRYDFTDDDCD